MFATRGAFRMARGAARQLAARPGLSNAAVTGGQFCQNCFVVPQIARSMSTFAPMQLVDGVPDMSSNSTELAELEDGAAVLSSCWPAVLNGVTIALSPVCKETTPAYVKDHS
eukprot:TRINITY_DN5722_c0_g1_i1.p2 TRINITY_DN5722_c0_g1~~TRINITY_DN5722_c0_g1_i1.p2  ORF type:complete len:112 (+),score=21.98 TRINITY_DN5722_c0_g1_i1:98-433(+)